MQEATKIGINPTLQGNISMSLFSLDHSLIPFNNPYISIKHWQKKPQTLVYFFLN